MRYPPKLFGGTRVSSLVSLADVMPTVLDLLDIDHPGSFDGRSVVDLVTANRAKERSVYLESLFPYLTYGWSEVRGVRTSRYKYIRLPTPELYDIGEDPFERTNLAREREDIVVRLEGELETLASQDSPQPLAEEAALSDLDRERLIALGYLSGGVPEREKASLRDPKEMIRYHELTVLGQQAIQAGNYAEAQEYMQQVVEGDPGNARARSALGMILYNNGNLAEAKTQLEKTIELAPESTTGDHFNLGIVLSALGRDEEAAASFERALELEPFRADYCIALARTYGKLGEAEKAQALYRRAKELEQQRKP
jgi:tetratricopeptide (TPR) repeat protein